MVKANITIIRVSTVGTRARPGASTAELILEAGDVQHCARSGKRRYADRQAAEAEIAWCERERSGPVVPVRAYECRSCGGFHLSSRERS